MMATGTPPSACPGILRKACSAAFWRAYKTNKQALSSRHPSCNDNKRNYYPEDQTPDNTLPTLGSKVHEYCLHGAVCIPGATETTITARSRDYRDQFPRVHAVQQYIFRAQMGSKITTLLPKYIIYTPTLSLKPQTLHYVHTIQLHEPFGNIDWSHAPAAQPSSESTSKTESETSTSAARV